MSQYFWMSGKSIILVFWGPMLLQNINGNLVGESAKSYTVKISQWLLWITDRKSSIPDRSPRVSIDSCQLRWPWVTLKDSGHEQPDFRQNCHFVPMPNIFNLKSIAWKLFSSHEIRVGQIQGCPTRLKICMWLVPDGFWGVECKCKLDSALFHFNICSVFLAF